MANGTTAAATEMPALSRAVPRGPRPAANAAVFVATFAAIIGLIAALLVFDLSLAHIDRLASDANAAADYEAGTALLARGRARDAAERFGAAVAADRANLSFALALARATLAAGDVQAAELMLQGLLGRAENDGAVNLAMAHTLLRENRGDEAESYFHRAIFGRWGADSTARRAGARFELIDLLARRGETQELLAELLPLQDTPPDSLALRRRLGQLFLQAGSPARSVAVLRDVVRRDPRDADAYAGLGEAALALGNFQTARADFAEAAGLRPDDARFSNGLALADTVLAIDPAARGIGAHARYERSRLLLSRTVAVVARCGSPGIVGAPFDSARAVLLATTRPPAEDAAGEAMVALANALWATRPARCTNIGIPDRALGIIHDRSRQ
ncbi:hypothetical protein tb265_47670 [Gemmatimonadetes bacterium T265]|nr:hypothetical protein tb265_47670 [Gemmatimonadetes bacterium T265]